MKTNTFSLLASIALLSFASCTDEMQELAGEQSQALKQIVMTTQDFQTEAGSRTIYQIADGAVKCTWATNDTVGVFPDEGAQAYFPMASGAGTKNASFDGKGWALKDGRTYGAYYPFVGAMYLDRNAVPVSYTGQTQTGNASMEHLGAYDYMVATPTAPEFGSAQFMFKHISALVQLKITVPQPATLTSVKLVTDTKAFAVEGTVDIMADAPSITPATSSTEVVLNLQNVATTEANQVVTLYMMLPPTDLIEQTLKAVVVSDKGKQEIALGSKNFQAGTAYSLSGELESSTPGYKDGVVIIAEAGTMKQLLGNNWLNISSLKVVGPINGDDVRCLRQMLGGVIEYGVNIEKGELAFLDLSEASIVEGDNWYYKNSSSSYYYTSNDVIGNEMFYNCDKLKEIVLPNGITSIGENAFYSCSYLTSIDIPNSVIEISEAAFSICASLISIDIPDGITEISNKAFYYCQSLTTVDIPDDVTAIGECAFYGCTSLTTIDIPDDVNSIGNSAFYNCSSLASINIPNSVTSIGSSAFYNCASLKSVHITDLSAWCKITFSNYNSNPLNRGIKLYLNNNELTELVVPADIKKIKDQAFYNCKSITKVTIGEQVISIGILSFRGCTSLAQVYCQGTTPPTINLSSADSSFNGSGSSRTLYVPKGCSSAYQSSDWASFFGSIQEME